MAVSFRVELDVRRERLCDKALTKEQDRLRESILGWPADWEADEKGANLWAETMGSLLALYVQAFASVTITPCTPPAKEMPRSPVPEAPMAPPSPSVSLAAKLEGMGLSPSRRRTAKEADPELTTLMELSPSRRHCGKQAAVMVLRRSSKLCQHPGCVFSRGKPGEPARAENTTYCLWCDEALMAEAMAAGGHALMHVRMTLSMFQEKDEAVYERALARLPETFTREAHLCKSPKCVFSSKRPGYPADGREGDSG